MGIGKGGSPTTTSNSQNQNVATVPTGLANFQNIYNRANEASQIPYQPYGGQLVAPITAQQQSGIGNINAAANPGGPDFQKFFNPYQQQVVNALTQNINETNAQQLQQVRGNAIAQHALGGDREAIAEAELARQQNLGNAPTIANVLSGGWNTAMQNALQTGEAQFNVGTAGQQTAQAQDTAAYQQYLQQLAYPYQQAQFLANIGIPAAGAMGGQQFQTGLANQIMTPPGISVGQGIAGLGLLGAGLFSGFGGGFNPSPSGAAATGGRIEHKYPGGRATDTTNPYAVDPWDVKAVDITGGTPGTPLQTPQNQIHPIPGLTITQTGQQSNPLGTLSQDITAAKGLFGLGKAGAGFLGGLGGAGAADALAAGTDAGLAIGGLGEGAAAAAAGAGVAADTGILGAISDLAPFALFAAKRGGAVYPKHFAGGGDAGDAAAQDIAAKAQQSGPLAQMMVDRVMFGQQPSVPHARGGSAYPRYDDGGYVNDDQPAPFASRFSALPTPAAVPLPKPRPAISNDDTAPDDSESAPTPVRIQKSPGFDPAAASYQDIMNRNNFKDYAPTRQSLMSLLRNPATRGDALMEMGLRILAAPPTSKSGLSEIATGALGTVADYNKFSENATTAQEKAQELAAKLKSQSNTDDYNDERLKLQKEQLKALTDYRSNLAQQRFQKLMHGNLVPGNYQYPGPTGAVVGAYFNKEDGRYYDANTHEPLTGGRWAGTSAVDLGLSKPPGAGAGGNDPIAAARAAIRAGAAPEAVKQRLIQNGITPPPDL